MQKGVDLQASCMIASFLCNLKQDHAAFEKFVLFAEKRFKQLKLEKHQHPGMPIQHAIAI